MAEIGTMLINVETRGSAVRIRALELAVETMGLASPVSQEALLERAAAFEKFITGA